MFQAAHNQKDWINIDPCLVDEICINRLRSFHVPAICNCRISINAKIVKEICMPTLHVSENGICPDAFLLLTDADDGLHNSHIVTRAVFLDCIHSAFQRQKKESSLQLTHVMFNQICIAREQALGERRHEILRAVLYAKSGMADVFNGMRPRQRNARSQRQPDAVPTRGPVIFRQGADLLAVF